MKYVPSFIYLLCFIFAVFLDHFYHTLVIFPFAPFFASLLFRGYERPIMHAFVGGIFADIVLMDKFLVFTIFAPLVFYFYSGMPILKERFGVLSIYSALFSLFFVTIFYCLSLIFDMGDMVYSPRTILSTPFIAIPYTLFCIECPLLCICEEEIS